MVCMRLTTEEISNWNTELAGLSIEDCLNAVFSISDRLILACSLGAEDMVLVHSLARTRPGSPVFILDTGRLHEETYETLHRAKLKYDLDFRVYFPESAAVEELLEKKGPLSFYESIENRKECCYIRKVAPLQRALKGFDGWITGLRKDQNVTRNDLGIIENDDGNQILKINPLLNWSYSDVTDYARRYNIPLNSLHENGYPSIGCEPCTRPIEPGADLRSGRWWWENPEHKECGLHQKR